MLAVVGAGNLRGHGAHGWRAGIVASRHLWRRYWRRQWCYLIDVLLTPQLLLGHRRFRSFRSYRTRLLLWHWVGSERIQNSIFNCRFSSTKHKVFSHGSFWTDLCKCGIFVTTARALVGPKDLKNLLSTMLSSWAVVTLSVELDDFDAGGGGFDRESCCPVSKVLATIIFTPSWTLHFFWKALLLTCAIVVFNERCAIKCNGF